MEHAYGEAKVIYISLGSNLGNRIDNLWTAVHLMRQRCLQNIQCSIIIETEALLLPKAPSDWNKPFLNMVVSGQTDLTPEELLQALKKIEREMGRPQEYEKWAPRMIDLDILLYGDEEIKTKNLNIPHLEINNRGFLKHLLALMGKKPWSLEPTKEFPLTKAFSLEPRLVGVVNVTRDSFSDGGSFYNLQDAIQQVLKLVEEGASVIEIGAQSTRPGAIMQPMKSEYEKLDEVLKELAPIIADRKITLSIDTFHPSIATRLLEEYDIDWINDVGGKFDDRALKVIAEKGCKFCLMHSLTVPPNRQDVLPSDQDPIDYLLEWGMRLIEKLVKLGFSLKDIILDPGLGFGKTTYQNIEILRNIEKVKGLGCQVMVGHSRKSFIRAFSPELEARSRDLETIGASLGMKDKVDFLRVHNVKDHMKAFVAHHTSIANI